MVNESGATARMEEPVFGPRWPGHASVRKAIDELAERLPPGISGLARLAYNYRWSWLLGGPELFQKIDPAVWAHTDENPRAVIESASPRRLRELAACREYVQSVERVLERFDSEMRRPLDQAFSQDHPIAYLCSEFGIHASIALYGGGLGVLAGDMLKSASDLGIPFVGVGIFYRQGYFRQRIDISGWQQEYWVDADFYRLPTVLVRSEDGEPLTVELILRHRPVRAQIWRVDVGRTVLYLLDTDREDNHPIDRWITGRLYVGDRHTRLAQYAVLGIGGMRALRVLGLQPSLIHLNEGHAALSSIERLRELLATGQSLEEALETVRRETVFTTHTPVPAGNESYSTEEVEFVLADYLDSLGLPREQLYGLARVTPGNSHEPISMTPLALRTSGISNGVSRRHGQVARGMWKPVWPDRFEAELPITSVTNGVHSATWMSAPMQRLLVRYLGEDWLHKLSAPETVRGIEAIPNEELWRVRCELREAFLDLVREHSIRERLARGEPPAYVDAAERGLDPGILTIGFARRVATYKRLYLLARFADRARQLLDHPSTPIQVVIAGKAHPQDHEAKEVLRGLFQFRLDPAVGRRVVFLEDYDLCIAPAIVSGVDLWLNLPRPPLEASGTSGMKVVLNGGLNLSVLDGWWEEACDGTNGWGIRSPDADHAVQDDHDAQAMLDVLENEVIPLFYDRGQGGVPHRWIQRVKASMRSMIWQFSAERMLREYVSKMYSRP